MGLVLLFISAWRQIGISRKSIDFNCLIEDTMLTNVIVLFTFIAFLCCLARSYIRYQFWATLGICIAGSMISKVRYKSSDPEYTV